MHRAAHRVAAHHPPRLTTHGWLGHFELNRASDRVRSGVHAQFAVGSGRVVLHSDFTDRCSSSAIPRRLPRFTAVAALATVILRWGRGALPLVLVDEART